MNQYAAAILLLILGQASAHAALQSVRFEPPGGRVRSPALVMTVNPNAAGTIF